MTGTVGHPAFGTFDRWPSNSAAPRLQAMSGLAFGKILFAFDESSHMRAAAYSVARLAHATRSEVILLHVVGKDNVTAPVERMEQIAKIVIDAGVPTTLQTRVARAYEVAEAIVDVAKQHDVGLVALGSRGLSDLSGFFRGSVSHRVIALSDCPVLVVRYGVLRPGGSIRRILLAIAGGEDVPHALEAAMAIARATDAEVLVLHARYLVTGLDGWPYVEPDEFAEQTLVKVVRRLRIAGVRVVARSPIAGTGIAHAIANEARAWDADLVVVGSRRLSDLASLLGGGIDHDVIRLSDQPVLIAERPDAPVPELVV
jgi:nucleotide-binding universal stress UspA family protein